VTGSHDIHVLRATFDDVPELYDSARPVAPREVFDDLVELAGLEAGSRLLEIGCGTGQATVPLVKRGFEIVAVELGTSLAELARLKLAPFPHVKIVTSSFEEWDSAGERFDAVVSFNAFHWIDPEVRISKSADVLVDGGSLAVLGSSFVEHNDADPVWLELQEDEAISGEPARHLDDVRDRSAEFTDRGRFATVTRKTYTWDTTYTADAYVALLATISRYNSLDDQVRTELFERIHRRIEAAGGTVSPTTFAVLYVAERA
jgi:SAM-dependent methyltransferase